MPRILYRIECINSILIRYILSEADYDSAYEFNNISKRNTAAGAAKARALAAPVAVGMCKNVLTE